jgi:DNA polymerase III subunit alpha
MAALLTSVRDDKDKSALYLNECRRMGIKVLPPDVNTSDADFSPRGDDIRFGLAAIRNIGENVVASIKRTREDKGSFTSFSDFLSKVEMQVCNKKTIESLIKSGAFDSFGSSRKGLMAIHLEALDAVTESKRAEALGQYDLFGDAGTSLQSVAGKDLAISTDEWEKSILLSYEREMLGLYVSDHPLLGVEGKLRSLTDMPISALSDDGVAHEQIVTIAGLITSVSRKVSKQGNAWAIVSIEDLEGAVEALFFANTYTQYAEGLAEDRVVVVRGRVDKREENIRFMALEMNFPDINQRPSGPVLIRLEATRCTPPLVDRMKEILRSHPGNREVHLQLIGRSVTTLKIDDALKVSATPSLGADLKALLGPDCIRF